MYQRRVWINLAGIGLVAATLACNAPVPTSQEASPPPPSDTPTALPSEITTTPTPTPSPTKATSTPTPTEITETATPTETLTPTPSPTPTVPVSTGPLDFAVPTALDHWRPLENGEMEVTIIVHITGGAPPYTVYHDAGFVTTTWEMDPKIVFQARGCSGIVHTITVESADGQTVKHDYWIRPPWCED